MKYEELLKLYGENGGKVRKKPRHREGEIQEAAVSWFRYAYPQYLIFSVPNGANKSAAARAQFKAEGLLSGVADLIIVSDHKILFIEMKTRTGRQQESQKAFQRKVEALGHKYIVCRSVNEFMIAVNAWLGKTPKDIRKNNG